MSLIHPVVLCGGSGTRLWPKSRRTKPKPFLPLVGEESLFEATLGRCSDSARFAAPVIVAGKAHLEHVEAQLAPVSGAQIIVEPEAKNTAAAIALAAARLPGDCVLLVCPSDHHIADAGAFCEAAQAAAKLARQGRMVAFGIAPTHPETGYGYIRRGAALDTGFAVERFVEKPDLERARQFVEDPRYSWNGGIFAFAAGAFLDELARHRPDLAAAVRRSVEDGEEEGRCFYPAPGPFSEIAAESIDYALMEQTDCAAMVPVAMGWSDIGSWQALRDARAGDARGNRLRGPVELVDCRNVLADSDGPRVSIIGLEDVAVIVDGGEVLVVSMRHAQKVGLLRGAAER